MRIPLFLLASFSVLPPLSAATPPITVAITGAAAHHELTFTTRPCYSYSVEKSSNLQSWTTVTPLELGTGDDLTFGFASTATKLYYRVREHDLGFMMSPQPNVPCFKEDGVCFAFKLSVLSQMPAKICISKRAVTTPPAAWSLIGKLTDFATLSGVKTVRGPAVWIPDGTGSFEVKAAALNSAGGTLCEVTRQISIVANTPPVISIVTGPTNANTAMAFTTTWSDPDFDDEVTRVEFYDYGALIGTDRKGPAFGDVIEDVYGKTDLFPNQLLVGLHEITAKAYDTRGGVRTSSPYSVNITAGDNYRPTISSISPGSVNLRAEGTEPKWIAVSFNDPAGSVTGLSGTAVSYPTGAGGPAFGDFASVESEIDTSYLLGDGPEFPGTYTLSVYVQDNHKVNGVDTPARSYPRFITARVGGSGYPNPQELANNIADGSTVVASNNADFIGMERIQGLGANGTFSNNQSQRLQMSSGVLLTTGQFHVWDNGNENTNTRYEWGTPGDTVLEDRITGSITRDAATLEFDVTCLNCQLECEVQFGSEEYPEFFNAADDHDAFAVTVDGVVISLVPDGGTVIGAHSVHPFVPKSSSVVVPPPPRDLEALRDFLYVDNPYPTSVEYDGLTIRLRLHAFVTPGVHHIRFSIADTNYTGEPHNASVDSALFIKAGSLRTINPALP